MVTAEQRRESVTTLCTRVNRETDVGRGMNGWDFRTRVDI